MNKLLALIYLLCLLLAVRAVVAAPTAHGPLRRHGRPAPAHIETPAEHLARFQVQLTNALHLQPHQVCVLHHALLAQTEAPLPGLAATQAPTLTEALRAVLRPEQLGWLRELPANASFAPEFATLALRP